MIELGKRATMLFDGDCGICTWFADLAMRMDVRRYFYVEPYQRVPEPEIQQFGLSHGDCARRLRVITRHGTVHSGAFAVNYFFIHYFPWNVLVVLLYVVTPLLLLEIITYELVARNRTRLSALVGNEGLPHAEIAQTGLAKLTGRTAADNRGRSLPRWPDTEGLQANMLPSSGQAASFFQA